MDREVEVANNGLQKYRQQIGDIFKQDLSDQTNVEQVKVQVLNVVEELWRLYEDSRKESERNESKYREALKEVIARDLHYEQLQNQREGKERSEGGKTSRRKKERKTHNDEQAKDHKMDKLERNNEALSHKLAELEKMHETIRETHLQHAHALTEKDTTIGELQQRNASMMKSQIQYETLKGESGKRAEIAKRREVEMQHEQKILKDSLTQAKKEIEKLRIVSQQDSSRFDSIWEKINITLKEQRDRASELNTLSTMVDRENDEYKKRNEELKHDNVKLMKYLSERSEEIRKQEKEYLQAENKLSQEVHQLKNQLHSQNDKIFDLTRQLTKLGGGDTTKMTYEYYNKMVEDNTRLQKELGDAKEDLSRVNTQKRSLQSEIHEKKQLIATLQRQFQGAERELKTIEILGKEERAENKSQIENLTKTLDQTRVELNKLRGDYAENNSKKTNEIFELKSSNNQLESDVQLLTSERDLIKKHLDTTDANYQKLLEQNDKIIGENVTKKIQIASFEKEAINTKAKITFLEKQVEVLREAKEGYEKENGNLRAENKQNSARLMNFGSQYQDVNKILGEQKKTNKKLKEQIETLEEEKNKLKNKNIDLLLSDAKRLQEDPVVNTAEELYNMIDQIKDEINTQHSKTVQALEEEVTRLTETNKQAGTERTQRANDILTLFEHYHTKIIGLTESDDKYIKRLKTDDQYKQLESNKQRDINVLNNKIAQLNNKIAQLTEALQEAKKQNSGKQAKKQKSGEKSEESETQKTILKIPKDHYVSIKIEHDNKSAELEYFMNYPDIKTYNKPLYIQTMVQLYIELFKFTETQLIQTKIARGSVQTMEQQVAQLTTKHTAAMMEIETYQNTSKERDAQKQKIEDLEEKLRNSKAQIEILNAGNKNYEAQISTAISEKLKAASERDLYRDFYTKHGEKRPLVTLLGENDDKEPTIESLSEKNTLLQQENTSLREVYAKIKVQMHITEVEKEEANLMLQEAKEQSKTLQKRLNDMTQKYKKCRDQEESYDQHKEMMKNEEDKQDLILKEGWKKDKQLAFKDAKIKFLEEHVTFLQRSAANILQQSDTLQQNDVNILPQGDETIPKLTYQRALQKKMDDLIAKHETEMKTITKEKIQAVAECEAYKALYDNKQASDKEAEDARKYKEKVDKYKELEAQFNQAKTDKAKTELANATLNAELSLLRATNGELEKTIQNVNKEKSALQKEHDKVCETLKEYTEDQNKYKKLVAAQEAARLAKFQQEWVDKQTALVKDEEKTKLEAELKEAKDKIDDLERIDKDLKTHATVVAGKDEEIIRKDGVIKKLEQDIIAITADKITAEAESKSLQARIDNFMKVDQNPEKEKEYREKVEKILTIEAEMKTNRDKNAELKTQIAVLNSEKAALEKGINAANAEKEKMRKERDEACVLYAEWLQGKDKYEKLLKAEEAKKPGKMQAEFENEQLLSSLKTEIATLKAANEKFNHTKDQLAKITEWETSKKTIDGLAKQHEDERIKLKIKEGEQAATISYLNMIIEQLAKQTGVNIQSNNLDAVHTKIREIKMQQSIQEEQTLEAQKKMNDENARMVKEIDDLKKKNASLQPDYKKMGEKDERIVQLSKTIETHEKTIDTLQSQKTALEKEKAEKDYRIQLLSSTIATADQGLDKLPNDDKLLQKLAEHRVTREAKRMQDKQQLEDIRAENARLNDKILSLEAANRGYTAAIAGDHEKMEQLTANNKQLQETGKTRQNTINSLTIENERLKKENENHEIRIRILSTAITPENLKSFKDDDALAKKLADIRVQKEMERLREQKKIEDLNEEINKLKEQKATLEVADVAQKKNIGELQKYQNIGNAHTDLQKQFLDTQGKLATANNQITELTYRLQNMTNEYHQLTQQIPVAVNQDGSRRDQQGNITMLEATSYVSMVSLKHKIQELTTANTELQGINGQLNHQVQIVVAEKVKLQAEVDSLKTQSSTMMGGDPSGLEKELRRQINQLQTTNTKLTAENFNQGIKIETLTTNVEALKNHVKNQNETIRQLDEKLIKCGDEKTSLKYENQFVEATNKRIENALKELQTELDKEIDKEHGRDITQLRAEFKKLRTMVSTRPSIPNPSNPNKRSKTTQTNEEERPERTRIEPFQLTTPPITQSQTFATQPSSTPQNTFSPGNVIPTSPQPQPSHQYLNPANPQPEQQFQNQPSQTSLTTPTQTANTEDIEFEDSDPIVITASNILSGEKLQPNDIENRKKITYEWILDNWKKLYREAPATGYRAVEQIVDRLTSHLHMPTDARILMGVMLNIMVTLRAIKNSVSLDNRNLSDAALQHEYRVQMQHYMEHRSALENMVRALPYVVGKDNPTGEFQLLEKIDRLFMDDARRNALSEILGLAKYINYTQYKDSIQRPQSHNPVTSKYEAENAPSDTDPPEKEEENTPSGSDEKKIVDETPKDQNDNNESDNEKQSKDEKSDDKSDTSEDDLNW